MSHTPEIKKLSIAIDLDGTLAHYTGWKGVEHIGKPIKAMKDLALQLHDEGHEVTIFTARVGTDEEGIKAGEFIAKWLRHNGFPDWVVTNIKEKKFTHFLDDRAYHVALNTGGVVNNPFVEDLPKHAHGSHFDTQVGGGHYKGYAIQPFEFVRKNNIPAAEAEVLTHVVRHADKNGIEDLKKSIHLIQLIAEMDYGVKI